VLPAAHRKRLELAAVSCARTRQNFQAQTHPRLALRLSHAEAVTDDEQNMMTSAMTDARRHRLVPPEPPLPDPSRLCPSFRRPGR
jgi:hypothetical protein